MRGPLQTRRAYASIMDISMRLVILDICVDYPLRVECGTLGPARNVRRKGEAHSATPRQGSQLRNHRNSIVGANQPNSRAGPIGGIMLRCSSLRLLFINTNAVAWLRRIG